VAQLAVVEAAAVFTAVGAESVKQAMLLAVPESSWVYIVMFCIGSVVAQ
jgi:hypothetical protein